MIILKDLINEYKEVPSKLDPSVIVAVTRKDDGVYGRVSHNFTKNGNAYLDIEERKIYIDGEEADKENWTRDHFLFVEAHEIAHIRLKHSPGNVDEANTDYYAICYLVEKGYEDAAAIGITQFKFRNGISFEEYMDKINDK